MPEKKGKASILEIRTHVMKQIDDDAAVKLGAARAGVGMAQHAGPVMNGADYQKLVALADSIPDKAIGDGLKQAAQTYPKHQAVNMMLDANSPGMKLCPAIIHEIASVVTEAEMKRGDRGADKW